MAFDAEARIGDRIRARRAAASCSSAAASSCGSAATESCATAAPACATAVAVPAATKWCIDKDGNVFECNTPSVKYKLVPIDPVKK
jgi:hypothetical protein